MVAETPVRDETLAGTLDDLEKRGYTAMFAVAGDGLRAAGTPRTFRPEDLAIREYHRFEGISDPDDMAIVYGIESRDGTRGTLVDAYGVYANPAVSRVVERVPIRLGS
jgi:hypothetical protein